MKRDYRWFLFVFLDTDKKELYKIIDCDTIKQVSYLVDLKPQVVSNYYHGLIKERGLLKYCRLYQASY